MAHTRLLFLFSTITTAVALAVACSDDPSSNATSSPDASSPDAPAPGNLVAYDSGSADAGTNRGAVDTGGALNDASERLAESACSGARPAAGVTTTTADGGDCAHDSDCDAGANGRCLERRYLGAQSAAHHNGPSCTYDACTTDSACPGAKSVCGCGAGWAKQNLCLTNSNCRTTADCASGQRCLYSDPPTMRYDDAIGQGDEVSPPEENGEAIGYFCTTPNDECTAAKHAGGVRCVYFLPTNHWIWGGQP